MSDLVTPPVWYHRSDGSTSPRFADVVDTATLWTADEYDAVLVGEPFGARAGQQRDPVPALVREALARTEVSDGGAFTTTVADIGDVDVDRAETSVAAVQATAHSFTRRIHARATVPIFFSGDGSFTYPNAAPLVEDGSLGVVRFGAVRSYGAADRYPAARQSYRQLFDEGLDALTVVGTRPDEDVTSEWGVLADRDWRGVTRETVRERPAEAAGAALASIAPGTVFVSVDLPALSVSDDQLRTMLRRVAADDRVAGLEVIARESAPGGSSRSTQAGSEAVAHFLLDYG